MSQDIDHAWDMSEDQLIGVLGIAQIGSESVQQLLQMQDLLAYTAEQPNAVLARQQIISVIAPRGEAIFSKILEEVKDLICAIHKDKEIMVEDKNLVEYLVGIIVASGKLPLGIAIFFVTLLVKRGLNRTCNI